MGQVPACSWGWGCFLHVWKFGGGRGERVKAVFIAIVLRMEASNVAAIPHLPPPTKCSGPSEALFLAYKCTLQFSPSGFGENGQVV